MERVIGIAMEKKQPAYILVAEDYALMTVTQTKVTSWQTAGRNQIELQNATKHIVNLLTHASSVVALPAYTISRLQIQRKR